MHSYHDHGAKGYWQEAGSFYIVYWFLFAVGAGLIFSLFQNEKQHSVLVILHDGFYSCLSGKQGLSRFRVVLTEDILIQTEMSMMHNWKASFELKKDI